MTGLIGMILDTDLDKNVMVRCIIDGRFMEIDGRLRHDKGRYSVINGGEEPMLSFGMAEIRKMEPREYFMRGKILYFDLTGDISHRPGLAQSAIIPKRYLE
jgi:hypothetical protein